MPLGVIPVPRSARRFRVLLSNPNQLMLDRSEYARASPSWVKRANLRNGGSRPHAAGPERALAAGGEGRIILRPAPNSVCRLSDRDLVGRAESFVEELGDRAEEIENARRLPEDLADRLATASLYTMCNPADYGGAGASPMAYAKVVETLARGDASAAWCTFIAITSAFHIASAQTDAVRQLLRPDVKTAGVFAPLGRARQTVQNGNPGFLVTGRWVWGSGSQNADWITGGALVVDDTGSLLRNAGGQARNIAIIFPASEVEFIRAA